ncbi:MAG: histidinol-phosphatase [Paludibacter sp.]
MYFANYHSHCTFCDGRSSMEEFVRFAIAKGVRKYGFSSHAPLPFDTFWNMKLDDFGEYQNEFYRLKEKYMSEVELFIGLEVDYIHNYIEIQNELYSAENMDYLIGSIHYMDQLPSGDFWTIDGNFRDFFVGLKILFDGEIRPAVERFFDISDQMIGKGGFDIVGHFDKIAMNASKCADFEKSSVWYRNRVSDSLQLIKQKELILEINTKSFVDKGITYPDIQFFPLINELQIPVVVNSDCHYPTNILDSFHPTFEALKAAGFKTMHQLIDGKWQAVEFDETGLLI